MLRNWSFCYSKIDEFYFNVFGGLLKLYHDYIFSPTPIFSVFNFFLVSSFALIHSLFFFNCWCVCMCLCVCIVCTRFRGQTSVLNLGSLTEQGAHWFGYTNWPASLEPLSISPALRAWMVHDFWPWCWGWILSSLRLPSRCFIEWAIFLAPVSCSYS